jgi:hypothetical protein
MATRTNSTGPVGGCSEVLVPVSFGLGTEPVSRAAYAAWKASCVTLGFYYPGSAPTEADGLLAFRADR